MAVLERRSVSSEAPHEQPPDGLAPWEPVVFYSAHFAVVGAGLLLIAQTHTDSLGIRLLASTLMLLIAMLILAESVFVLFDIRGVLWRISERYTISGRPAGQQLKPGNGGTPRDRFFIRVRAVLLLLAAVTLLAYAVRGL
jgi:hypothetical protein